MKFSHYSKANEELTMRGLQDVERQPVKDVVKPKGLWLSVDGPYDWLEWCRGEQFGHYDLRQEVTLRSNAIVYPGHPHERGVLHMDRAAHLSAFTKYYRGRMYTGDLGCWIDWQKVAQDYDGVIIAPYQWSSRMDLIWYYPWDCASGVIWRPTKWVESISEPEPFDFHPKVTQEGNSDGEERPDQGGGDNRVEP